MSDTPTKRQLDVLRAIQTYRRIRGYSPAVDELRRMLLLRSKNGIAEHLRALIRKGLAEHTPKVARTIRPTSAGYRALRRWFPSEPQESAS